MSPQIEVHGLDLLGDSKGLYQKILNNIKRLTRLRAAIKNTRPDAVIGFGAETNILTLLASRGLPAPIVVADCADPRVFPTVRAWRALRSIVYPLADRIVCQTTGTFEALGRPRQGKIIGNPIEVGPQPEAEPARVVVAAGRFVREKGFDLLIEAFARIAAEVPAWRLVIYGDGPERTALTEQAEASGYAQRIEFPGVVANLPTHLAKAAVFALPSRTEGFGNVLAEAMATGRAVVAADCPTGPGTLVSHGQSGLLVPPEDPAALADALRRLISDDRLRARLGKAAAEAMQAYRPDRIARAWIDILAATSRSGGR